MLPVLVGSQALLEHGIDLRGVSYPKSDVRNRVNRSLRSQSDYDFIATFDGLTQMQRWAGKTLVQTKPLSVNKTVLFLLSQAGIAARLPKIIIEVEIAWPGTAAWTLLESCQNTGVIKQDMFGYIIPSLDQLYTLKMSHRYLRNSVHFIKTRNHIFEMRVNGAKIWDEAWLKQREKETYIYEHPKLSVDKTAFFKKDDGVKYIFDHDSIHRAMALLVSDSTGAPISLWGDAKFGRTGGNAASFYRKIYGTNATPAYEFYKSDNAQVQCDRNKWDALPHFVKLMGVLEEAYVLALERSQIPYGVESVRRGIGQPPKVSPYANSGLIGASYPKPMQSFSMALNKVCTSITSGWFREFAWENFDAVLNMAEVGDNGGPSYVDRFWTAVDAGMLHRWDHQTA